MTAPAIDVRGLTRRFGAFTAVSEVSFQVAEGEIFGYLGANGAGKSTTIRMLCGLLAPSGGQATVAGVDVVRRPRAVRSAIGYMSQRFSLYLDLTVEENLRFFGGAYGLFGDGYRSRRDAVTRALEMTRLGGELTGALPGGARQRVALACALLHGPRVVFLDEPTAGVDPEARRTFWRLIRRLADGGTTVFVTTHAMDEAEYCDRVGLMVSGKLAALDTPAGLARTWVRGRMIEVVGPTVPEVAALAGELGFLSVEPFGAGLHLLVTEDGPSAETVARLLSARHLPVTHAAPARVTLEDVFLRVVGHHAGRRPEGGAS